MIATTVNLLVYVLPSSKVDGESEKQTGKRKDTSSLELRLEKTVERPALPGGEAGSSFRSVRFHPTDPKVLYTVVNTVPPRSRTKNAPRKAFVCRWNTDTWEITKHRKVSDRSVTCFDIRWVSFNNPSATAAQRSVVWMAGSWRLVPRITRWASSMRKHFRYGERFLLHAQLLSIPLITAITEHTQGARVPANYP